ncbi:hypothetical protein P3X46_025206 [Hevea brasiliensis]|uniref:FAD-binding FR-type domain-containing protein n=1 Tax=Hevea brasiliensis TaxID=3981 RepID=A0ABQ9L4W3_HEVBR|nr:ferric reduction oxidase 7, chloroplastic [Hevea brasiliensis]KAJ9159727.1 hypothetical protein P3X46_025206 [Hevea brasiliensis]
MDEQFEAQQLLLSNGNVEATSFREKTPFFSSLIKWLLNIVMWATLIVWVAVVFMYPLESVQTYLGTMTEATADSFLGFTGSVFLIFSGPVIIISVLSALYLILTSGEDKIQEKERRKGASYRLRTFPVIVDGPFGIVSAGELIVILLFVVYITWVAGVYAVQKLSVIFHNSDYTIDDKWSWTFRMSARGFGLAGMFCLSFMFIPVARGSLLLRLVNVPFHHGIRYHMWLGHLCMILFSFHGFLYLIGWIMAGEIPSELIAWEPTDGANLAGIINIFFGWSIWITSIPFVRAKNFELFYYTHHLYIIFIIFLAMHVGNFFFCIPAGAIFLFIIDRFIRFFQSRNIVDIISTRSLPCGVTELVLSKPASLSYNALSCVFLQLRELSFLQWHPFSVSSSPLDGTNSVSVLIKALGVWTFGLKDTVEARKAQENLNLQHVNKLRVSLEGPYGHELPCHLTYENLVLVAGGIGISPFIAILSDVIHRINEGKPCLPRKILLVWAVKRSEELSLLSTINMASISQFPLDELHLETLFYVTREQESEVENGLFLKAGRSSVSSFSSGNVISGLASSGNKIWFGAYVISSSVGLVTSMILLNIFYITPFGITNWWYQGLLLLACMEGSVVIFGGAVIGLWHIWEKSKSVKERSENRKPKIDEEQNKDSFLENLASSTTIKYGSRPDFKEIFGSISKLWGYLDVGVIVCGPPTLQSSVARECRSLNMWRKSSDPIFHFNSHSFSL